jgi:NitT/TauT family transport system permease protein
LWQDLWATVVVFLLGYLLGSGIGILIGVVMGSFSFVREVLGPYIAFFNAVPRLILLPLLVVIFGFGQFPQVLLVVLVIVFLVIVNVTDGIDEVRGDLIANSRILGANRYHLIRDVYAPSLAIRLISTGRVTIGYAIQATVAAELIGASRGLGFRITDGQSKDAAQEIFAAFAVLMVLALVVDVLLSVAERRATRWMPS